MMNNILCDSIPVRTLTYKNPKAAEERHEAICKFVDILTPQEIKGLTKFYAETWTLGELNYHRIMGKEELEAPDNDYKIIWKCKEPNSRIKETKLHLSFRYKFQKFAYVLVSLASPLTPNNKG